MAPPSDIEPEDLSERIRDAVLRSEIVKALEKEEPPTFFERVSGFFAHPFILAIVGFAFTAVISFCIEQRIAERQDARAERAEHRQAITADELAARGEMIDLHGLIEARIERARLLRSALYRDSPEEVVHRKALYDIAYFNFNAEYEATAIDIRQFIFEFEVDDEDKATDSIPATDTGDGDYTKPEPATDDEVDPEPDSAQSAEGPDGPTSIVGPSSYEDVINYEVITHLRASDRCLTSAFDVYRRDPALLMRLGCGADGALVYWHEFSHRHLEAARHCNYRLLQHALSYFRSVRDWRLNALEPGYRRNGASLEFIPPEPTCLDPSHLTFDAGGGEPPYQTAVNLIREYDARVAEEALTEGTVAEQGED